MASITIATWCDRKSEPADPIVACRGRYSRAVTAVAVSLLGLIALAVVVVLIALTIGGYVAAQRRQQSGERELLAQLRAADGELARAHAADKGWERSALEAAARRAIAERYGDVELLALALVQVLDRPGVDADQAIFLARTTGGEYRITLGRAGGIWGAV